jgi:predicted nuclease of predicted toxin-antitoxin system
VRFFVDENLDGAAFVEPLRAAGIDLTRHRDRFAQGVADTEWLPAVADEGLIVLTADVRIRFRPLEVAAIVESRARVLLLRKGKRMTHARLAALLIRSKEVVADFFESCREPCVGVLASRPDSDDPEERKPGRISVPKTFTPAS